MTSRERIRTIFAGGKPDRCGFWLGNPHADTWQKCVEHLGIQDGPISKDEQLRRLLGDDFRWIFAQGATYKHPQNKPIWELDYRPQNITGSAAVFADCEDAREVEDFPWPNPDYLDFTPAIAALKSSGEYYRASGMWCDFFHVVAAFFGMESYFVKMYTHPEVVDAVTAKICEFYLNANERYFAEAKNEMDGFFFGNDFGTQLDLLISPGLFDRFVMPWFARFTEQGHRHGYQVILHSCGAIHKVIDRLIEAKVDALHPLQARASDMDAATLARDFGGRIAFMGGIDTQDLLINGTPDQIRDDVRRVKSLLGPNLVVSPSHEVLLPNIPVRNIVAMAEAAAEI